MLVFIYKNTPIRFYNFRDTAVNLTLSLSFVIIAYMLKAYSIGWAFVIVTIAVCTLAYMCGQYIAKTSSSMMLVEMIKTKLNLHKGKLV